MLAPPTIEETVELARLLKARGRDLVDVSSATIYEPADHAWPKQYPPARPRPRPEGK
jgi:hypothetical protein